MSRITIKDIARIAQVSPTTVSLVLNGKPGISKDTKYRVLRVARELSYTPNLVARSLVSRQSDSVALLITNTKNPIFPEIGIGGRGSASAHGTLSEHHLHLRRLEDRGQEDRKHAGPGYRRTDRFLWLDRRSASHPARAGRLSHGFRAASNIYLPGDGLRYRGQRQRWLHGGGASDQAGSPAHRRNHGGLRTLRPAWNASRARCRPWRPTGFR